MQHVPCLRILRWPRHLVGAAGSPCAGILRVAAQARGKATKRADAVDLAEAAQSAIERFIAERGITKTEADTSRLLVSRLQARGYIVVREDNGWVIDQRHRIASETDLVSFAEARGISLGIAA